LRHHLHVQLFRQRHRLAVEVRRSRGWTHDPHVRALNHRHFVRAVQRAPEQARQQQRCTENGQVVHDHDVQQPVLQRRQRCDARVVAVLAGVGDGDDERLLLPGLPAARHRVLLGVKLREGAQSFSHVGLESADVARREPLGDDGIEADAHDAEEGGAVHRGGVDGDDPPRSAGGDAQGRIEREPDVAREAVARARGQNAQGRCATDQPFRGLVDRSVTAHREDDVEGFGLCAIDDRVQVLLRAAAQDLVLEQSGRADHLADVGRSLLPGAVVDEEEGLHRTSSRWRSIQYPQGTNNHCATPSQPMASTFGGGGE
jgi:hypothetical protein